MDVVARRRLWARLWRWLVALVALVAVSVFLFAMLSAQVLDLARAATPAHLEALRRPPPCSGPAADPDQVCRFFTPQFRFDFHLPPAFPRGFALRSHQIVYLGPARAGELVGYAGETLISIYVVDRKDLPLFPEAEKVLIADGKARSFEAGGFRFAAAVKGAVVACAIGSVAPEVVEEIAAAMAAAF